jgi:hypothetical protein
VAAAPVSVRLRNCERFKQFAQRLIDAGKAFKVVVTATMRKLLITLNQMVKTNTTYSPKSVVSVP